jgi:hypothetical protein
MKAKSSFYLLFIIILCSILSCKKDNSPASKREVQVDVYIASSVIARNGHFVVAYWKNGTMYKLTDSLSDSFASNILVNGTDVYVTGVNGGKGATYWKNGQAVILSTSGETNAIAVSGNDVYVVGSTTRGLCYWKNGVITNIPGPTSYNPSTINSIAVKDNNVYLVGGVYATNGNSVATYWKNGIQKRLVDSTLFSYARGITIQGNDVYISGYSTLTPNGFGLAAYWKNGEIHSIVGNRFSEALSIAVSGSDIYLAGNTKGVSYNYTMAAYWKNGVETQIGNEGPGNYANTIQVAGSDIYVSAITGNSNVYWKNNMPIIFTNDYGANPTAMAVVPR